jgi:hypothetical protein
MVEQAVDAGTDPTSLGTQHDDPAAGENPIGQPIQVLAAAGIGPEDPEAAIFQGVERARQVRHSAPAQPLDRPGTGPGGHLGQRRSPPLGLSSGSTASAPYQAVEAPCLVNRLTCEALSG